MAGNAISLYQGQIAVRGQGHTTCLHHKGKPLDWFCESCHNVVCDKCISTLHKGHDIVRLSEITPNNKRKIKTFINETEQKELIQIQQEINSTQDSLEKHLSHFNSVAEEVKRHGKKLKEDIDVLIAETISELKHLEDENARLLTSYKTNLEKKLAELKDQLNQCKKTLQTGTDIQVFDVTSILHTDITLPRRPVLGTAKFNQNKNPFECLTAAVGKMILTSSGVSDGHISAEVDKSNGSSDSFKTLSGMEHSAQLSSKVLSEWDAPCDIRYICPGSDSGAWTCGANKTLTQLTSEGIVKQQIKSHVRITSICVSPCTQNIWACSEDDNSVMELKPGKWLTTSTLVRKFNTKDTPTCLCATKNDHVLVGTKLGIAKYTPGGKPSPMTASQSKKPVVHTPWTISECPVSENVAVLDGDRSTDGGENEPAIILMDKHLQELYRYGTQQHTGWTGSQTFNPLNVTYDNLGQLVVADCCNNCLHLLSGDGEYLRLIHTDIYRPRYVCVDREAIMWVAFGGMFRANKIKRLQYNSD